MPERDPVYYVWSEYVVNLKPSELEASRANPRIRAAEAKTHCRVEFTRRVLNRRQSITDWSRFSIIRITGPDDQSIAQCNRLLEQIIPAYHMRQEYPRRAPITVYSKNVEAEGDLRSRLSSLISHRTSRFRRSESGGDKIFGKGLQGSEQADKGSTYVGTALMSASPKTDTPWATPLGSKVTPLLTRKHLDSGSERLYGETKPDPKFTKEDSAKTVDNSCPTTKLTIVSPNPDVLTTKSFDPNIAGHEQSEPGLESILGENKVEYSKIAGGSVTHMDAAHPVARSTSVSSEPDILVLNPAGVNVDNLPNSTSIIPVERNRFDRNDTPIARIPQDLLEPNDPSGHRDELAEKDYHIIQVASEHSTVCAITSESASFRPLASFEDSNRSKISPGVLDKRNMLSADANSNDPVPRLAAEHTSGGSGFEVADRFDVNQIVPKLEVDLGDLVRPDGSCPLELTVSVERPEFPESGLELVAGSTELVDEIQPVHLSFDICYTGSEIQIAVQHNNELPSLLGTVTYYLNVVSCFHRALSVDPYDSGVGLQVKIPDPGYLENVLVSDDKQSLAILPYPLPGVPQYRFPDSAGILEGSTLPSTFVASSDALAAVHDVGPLTQDVADNNRETPSAMQLPVGRNESVEMGNCLLESVLNETDPVDTINARASALSPVDSARRAPDLGSPTTINTNVEVSVNPETGYIGLEFEIRSGSPIIGAPTDEHTSFTAEWHVKLERNALFGPVGSFRLSPSNN